MTDPKRRDRRQPPSVRYVVERRLLYALLLFWGLEQLLTAITGITFDVNVMRLHGWRLIQLVNGIWLFRFGVTGLVKEIDAPQARALSVWIGIWWCSGLAATWQNLQNAPPLNAARQALGLQALEITGLFLAVLAAMWWLRQTVSRPAPAVWLAALTHIAPVALLPQQSSTLGMAVSRQMPVPAMVWPMTTTGILWVFTLVLTLAGRRRIACRIAMLALVVHLGTRLGMDLVHWASKSAYTGMMAALLHLIYACAGTILMFAWLYRTQRDY